MTTTDPTAGLQIVSGDYDEAAAHHDAMLREIEALRSQLAEARQQRDQAAEALAAAESERDAARDAQVQHATAMAAIEIIDDLRAVLALSPGQSLTQAVTQLRDDLAWLRAELDQYATQMERAAAFAAQSGAWSGQIIALYERHADRLRRMLTATAPEHEHRDECERCDHLDGSICPECPLAAPSAPETAEPCPRWHTTAVDAAKAVARELGVQAVIAGELVDAVKALKAELEMAEQDRDLARQAAENWQRERDAARAALATAERERDALRTQLRRALDELGTTSIPTDEGVRWLAESLLGAREKLAAVAEIADNLEKAEVGSVMTYGDARGIAATLRAALGATPDTADSERAQP